MKMSGGEGRKVDIDMVHRCIEQCLKLYMSEKEAVDTLHIQKNIKPQITEIVWQRLEKDNQEFFKAYYLNLALKEQIKEFNKLLAEQVELMRRTGLVGVSSIPTVPNGSNIPTVQQVHCARENHLSAMGSNGMHTPVVTNAFTNHGPTMDPYTQSPMCFHNGGVDVPFNMVLAQRRSMGIRPTLNGGGVVDREANYTSSSFNYAAPSNFVGSHSAMADASVPFFGSVDSGLQPPNGSLMDTDPFSPGYLGQFSQYSSLQNLIYDAASHTDILDGYSDSPFLALDSNNILDPRGHIGRFE